MAWRPRKVSDLQEGQAYGLLLCRVCGAECSADSRDYWHVPPDYVFECCDEPMALVRKTTRYAEVS